MQLYLDAYVLGFISYSLFQDISQIHFNQDEEIRKASFIRGWESAKNGDLPDERASLEFFGL